MPSLCSLKDRRKRHYRNSKADLDRTLNGLDVVEFGDLGYIDALRAENLVDRFFVSRISRSKCNEILPGQVLCLQRCPFGEFVVWRTDDNEFVRRHLDDLRRFGSGKAITEFGVAVQDIADDLCGPGIFISIRAAGNFDIYSPTLRAFRGARRCKHTRP